MFDPKPQTTRQGAEARLVEAEELFTVFFEKHLFKMMRGVYEDAVEALSAPVITASASPSEPFKWSMVQRRWYATIREMADARTDLMTADVIELLEKSDLPVTMHSKVTEVLKQSVEEGWSEFKTKRELSSNLIVKRKKGEPVDSFANRVRGLARTSANLNLNVADMKWAVEMGFTHKVWTATLDDRTRDSHWAANGQNVALDGSFTVGGNLMAYPCDMRAPIGETINCRCVLVFSDSGPTLEGY